MKRTGGFTLIELMIVVAIIAIVAAIAIPSLLNSRKASNEASAVGSLRALVTVTHQYNLRFRSFPSSLTDLQTLNYIDNVLGSGAASKIRRPCWKGTISSSRLCTTRTGTFTSRMRRTVL